MSWKCGNNLTAVLNDAGTLTISGTGRMFDFSDHQSHTDGAELRPPWWKDRMKIICIDLQHGIESVGQGAFYDCSKLTEVKATRSLKTIKPFAFAHCLELNTLSDLGNILEIGAHAFAFCSNLKSFFILNNNISPIDFQKVFYECCNLTDISVIASQPLYNAIEGLVLTNNLSDLIFVPQGRQGSLELPTVIKTIQKHSILNTFIIDLFIPQNVTYIQSEAIVNNTFLESITILNNDCELGHGNFFGCPNLKTIYTTNEDIISRYSDRYKILSLWDK